MADGPDAGELQRKVRRLEAILDASTILNSTLELGSLLALLLDLAVRNLEATRGTIYLVDRERGELWSKVVKGDGDDDAIEIRVGLGVGIAGQVAATGETINVKDVSADRRFFSPFDPHAGSGSRNMLCMPMRNRQGIITGVFQIIDRQHGAFDAEDERFLAAFADHAAITLETARLHEELVTKRLLDQELQFAATIQQRLLPARDVRIPGYDVAGAMRPSRSVGGDYFDIIPDGDRGAILVVADVAGKGLPAALLVSTLHAALHAYLQADLTFELLLQKLNVMLLETATPERYATLFLGDLRTDNHTLRYVNAGHPPPVLLSPAGDRLLEANGIPVGLLPDMTWQVGCVSLRPNDVLIAYSDGITEAADDTGEEFGSERVHASARHAIDGTPAETILRISREVDAFARGVQADDQTLLVLKRDRDRRP